MDESSCFKNDEETFSENGTVRIAPTLPAAKATSAYRTTANSGFSPRETTPRRKKRAAKYIARKPIVPNMRIIVTLNIILRILVVDDDILSLLIS